MKTFIGFALGLVIVASYQFRNEIKDYFYSEPSIFSIRVNNLSQGKLALSYEPDTWSNGIILNVGESFSIRDSKTIKFCVTGDIKQ